MKELDDAEATHRAAAKMFAEVVGASAKHVVEVDRKEAVAFREQVEKLADRVSTSTRASELEAEQARFRGELRDYSQKAGQHVQQLREDLDASAEAMRTFVHGVSASSGEHETVLRREFTQLERASEVDDVRSMRASIHTTVQAVSESFENLKRANALNIAQLRDEIRVLQGELKRGQSQPEPVAGTSAKQEFDTEIEELLRFDRAFAVLLVGIPERGKLHERFPKERVDTALTGLLKSATALVKKLAPKATMAEWEAGVYGSVMPSGAKIGDWQKQLSVSHVFQVDGMPRTLRLDPRVELVERAAGESHTLFFSRLSKASENVTKAD